jgi:hypothetical protein
VAWPDTPMTLAEREKWVKEIGLSKSPRPTKTGPRPNKAQRKADQKRRKAAAILNKRMGDLDKGDFFHRIIRGYKIHKDHFGRPDKISSVEYIRIAKILDEDLWLRNDHKDAGDNDPARWSKAKNASAKRLTQEIRCIGTYLEKQEITPERAEELLDLLYKHLGEKIK